MLQKHHADVHIKTSSTLVTFFRPKQEVHNKLLVTANTTNF